MENNLYITQQLDDAYEAENFFHFYGQSISFYIISVDLTENESKTGILNYGLIMSLDLKILNTLQMNLAI